MKKSIKDEFQKNRSAFAYPATLARGGKCGSGNVVGQHWDKMLSNKIEEIKQSHLTRFSPQQPLYDLSSSLLPSLTQEEEEEEEEEVETLLIKEIFNQFGINFFDSHFPLYGYMSKTEESSKVYLWQGEADAVGWYKDNNGVGIYVIVDWKVLDILDFWTKNPGAYGKYLHQCLVYAKLLQLHLQLNYLPAILIVPISGTTGQDIHPSLFYEYPEKCKEMIESYEWSTTLPEPPPPVMTIDGNRPWPFSDGFKFKNGTVGQNMPLREFFDKDATVRDLFEVFGRYSFEVI